MEVTPELHHQLEEIDKKFNKENVLMVELVHQISGVGRKHNATTTDLTKNSLNRWLRNNTFEGNFLHRFIIKG